MSDSLPSRLPNSPPRRGSWFTVLLALIACMMGAAFLLIMPTGFIGPVMVFGGLIFFGVIGLHYLVWGRWISKIVQEEQADDKE